MKGNFPKWIYFLMVIAGAGVIIAGSVLDLTVAAPSIGAGLFAYGVCRLAGEWRTRKNPEYAKQMETANKDERLAFIADKARSLTLVISIIILAILGIIFLSVGLKPYGFECLFIMSGISFLYFIVYQVVSRRY